MTAMNVGEGGVQGVEIVGSFFSHLTHLYDALVSTEEMLRIEVAHLDESLCFLCASAGVGGLHQSALALHEVVEVAARPSQFLTETIPRDVEQLRAHAVRHAENLTEDEDDALVAIEAKQHGGCTANL